MADHSKELDLKDEICIKTEEVEIKEEEIESYERNPSEVAAFNNGNFTPEWQSLWVKNEMMNITMKEEPLDLADYEKEISDCDHKNVGSPSKKKFQSLRVKSEMMDIAIKDEPLDLNDYEKEISDCDQKNVGSSSIRKPSGLNMSREGKRKRTVTCFQKKWLDEFVETATPKSYEIMRVQLKEMFRHNSETGVICTYCHDAEVINAFASGKMWNDVWKLDFLKRHLSSKTHLDGVNKLRHKNHSLPAKGMLSMLLESPAEKKKKHEHIERSRLNPEEIKVLIDNVLLAVNMNSSMLSVHKINEHMAKYVHIPEDWRSKNYAFEFLESINNIVQKDVLEEIASSAFHTLVIDESTDITINKYLILYFKFRPKNSTQYKTSFGGILELRACDASTIVSAIKQFYEKHKLDLHKMVMLTSDGASVMLGKDNGVAAQLKQDIFHLVQQHCVTHREDLGICDAWKEVKQIKDIETLMRTIYSVFSRSSTKKHKFQEIVNASENESVAFRPLNEVRWLSRQFALQAVMKNYDSLIDYFEQDATEDPIASYCYKKLTDPNYRIALEVLNDVLQELASLCVLFQKRGLTPLDAFHLAHGKLNKMKGQYLGNKISWSDKVKTLLNKYHQENIVIDTHSVLTFIEKLCSHLEDRFPENEVKEWSAFDCSAILQKDFDFGIEHVKALCAKYADFLGESSTIIEQYNDFKFVVCEKIKSKLVKNFDDMVTFVLQNEQFCDLAKLMDIGETFLVSSVDCEHGFSLMNSIKNKLRNRLKENHLDMLMRIKSYLNNDGCINLHRVYLEWANVKDRREKS